MTTHIIYNLPQEVIDKVLQYLYLDIVNSSLTIDYAQKKLKTWQHETGIQTFGSALGLRWTRSWHEFQSVRAVLATKASVTSVFMLLPQEIVDDITEYHFLSLLNGSLYTGGALTKILAWQNTATQALGSSEAMRWVKSMSNYPSLVKEFNAKAEVEYIQDRVT